MSSFCFSSHQPRLRPPIRLRLHQLALAKGQAVETRSVRWWVSGLWSLAQIPGRGLVVLLHHDRLSPYRPVTPGVNGEWGGVGQYPTRCNGWLSCRWPSRRAPTACLPLPETWTREGLCVGWRGCRGRLTTQVGAFGDHAIASVSGCRKDKWDGSGYSIVKINCWNKTLSV